MYRLILIVLIVMNSGSAITNISFYQYPDFHGAGYKSFVVMSGLITPEDKAVMETEFCAYLENYLVDCTRGIDLYASSRTYTDAEFAETFRRSAAEAMVVIEPVGSYTDRSWARPTVNIKGNVTSYGNTSCFYGSSSTSTGHLIEEPVTEYEVFIIDGKIGKKSIAASAVTKGNAFTKTRHLSESIVASLVKHLLENKLIVKKGVSDCALCPKR